VNGGGLCVHPALVVLGDLRRGSLRDIGLYQDNIAKRHLFEELNLCEDFLDGVVVDFHYNHNIARPIMFFNP
jgi:hypothetical protein